MSYAAHELLGVLGDGAAAEPAPALEAALPLVAHEEVVAVVASPAAPTRWRSSGTYAIPRVAPLAHVAVGEVDAVDEDPPADRGAEADHRLDELRLSAAGDAGDADDLTGTNRRGRRL